MKNRAAYMVGLNKMEIRETPVPEPKAGEVLVKIEYVGICGSDVHYFKDGRCGDFVVDGELMLGHEAGGVVEKLGEGVTDLKVGDKIASLVSLSLTPLKINKIKAIHPEIDRVDVEAQAILFESGLYAKLPDDMSEELALAALEATLLDWRDGTAVPVSAMLSAPPEELRRRAEALAEALSPLHPCTAVETQGEVGGGARPGESLPAWAAASTRPACSQSRLTHPTSAWAKIRSLEEK